jgi:hypothetical protein
MLADAEQETLNAVLVHYETGAEVHGVWNETGYKFKCGWRTWKEKPDVAFARYSEVWGRLRFLTVFVCGIHGHLLSEDARFSALA